jgi:biotin carboxylase
MAKHQTLLVLGASNYQCHVIQRARQRGIRVIVVDSLAENPGHRIVDESHVVSTTEISEVLQIATESKIDGIISPATDVAVPTQATVAKELGLFGPPPSAARILTSKSAFFDHLGDLGFAVPPFDTLASHFLPKDFSPPSAQCVVKPDDSSGGKGATFVSDPAHLAPAIERALQHSRSGRAVAQHYEAGFQGTAEGCLLNGEIAFSLITERQLPRPPVVATAGHTTPSGLSRHQTERVLDDVKKLFASLSIFDTIFDADFVWSGDEPKFLELTPRMGGNSLSQLARYHCGVSLEDMAIDLALTGTASIIKQQPYTGTSKIVLLHSNEGGRLEYDPSRLPAALEVDGIKRIVLDWDPGTVVSPFLNGRHRFGEIIAQGTTPDAADAAIERARTALELRIV